MRRRIVTDRKLITICLVMVAGIGVGSAHAESSDSPLDSYLRALESSYKGVRTLQADFSQTRVWGNKKRTESGTVYLSRGGLMRWDYREPSSKLFVATGKDLYLYVPADQQATRTKAKASADERVPFRMLLTRLNLRKVFAEIRFDDGVIQALPGNRVLRAVPKKADEAGYGEVWMEITPEFDIRRLVIHYADRSRMEFVFTKIEHNTPLSPSLFTFTPPPGTTLIDQK